MRNLRVQFTLPALIAFLAFPYVASAQPGPRRGEWHNSPAGKEILAKFDKDKDGKLSASERKTMMKARLDSILAKYDKNKNGRLELAERKRWATDGRIEIFKKLDSNNDQIITQQEADRGKSRQARILARRLQRIDTNGDGAIGVAELESSLLRRPLPGSRGEKRGKHGRPGMGRR